MVEVLLYFWFLSNLPVYSSLFFDIRHLDHALGDFLARREPCADR